MGRRPRIEYYGAIYHVIQRGSNRKLIFIEDRDKEMLLEILSEVKEICDFKIYAYTIMNNHYHLLIQTLNIPISRIMHRINTRYAKYYNFSRSRTGPVFDRRYRGILVQDESYLLNLIRYIHNNPVAANICNTMENYQWSSDIFYRINMESIVDIDKLLDMLSLNRVKAMERYAKLMEYIPMDYRDMKKYYEDIHIIGTDEFKKEIESAKDEKPLELDRILQKVCPTKEDFKLVKCGSRKRYLTKYKKRYVELARKAGYSYKEIGDNIGITKSAISFLLRST
ncbi:MAG TPA: hypothetical protein GXX70_01010 [Tepidimicrobium sp.]|nr:hypothetical protein [Tepidimicrobium sp.]